MCIHLCLCLVCCIYMYVSGLLSLCVFEFEYLCLYLCQFWYLYYECLSMFDCMFICMFVFLTFCLSFYVYDSLFVSMIIEMKVWLCLYFLSICELKCEKCNFCEFYFLYIIVHFVFCWRVFIFCLCSYWFDSFICFYLCFHLCLYVWLCD